MYEHVHGITLELMVSRCVTVVRQSNSCQVFAEGTKMHNILQHNKYLSVCRLGCEFLQREHYSYPPVFPLRIWTGEHWPGGCWPDLNLRINFSALKWQDRLTGYKTRGSKLLESCEDRRSCSTCVSLQNLSSAIKLRTHTVEHVLMPGLNFPAKLYVKNSVYELHAVTSVLTAGDDVALPSCLMFWLCIRMELLEAYRSSGWIQNHRALVNRDLTRPTDGVGGWTPNRCLIVWRNVVWTVCVELEHDKDVFHKNSHARCEC